MLNLDFYIPQTAVYWTMRRLVLISLILFAAVQISVAQEISGYRYYKLYEPTDEAEPLVTDVEQTGVVTPAPEWSRPIFEDISAVVNDYRAVSYYQRGGYINGIRLGLLSGSSRIALSSSQSGADGDYLYEPTTPNNNYTNTGVTLSTKGYNVGITASSAHTIGKHWNISNDSYLRTGRDLHIRGVYTHSAAVNTAAIYRPDSLNSLYIALLLSASDRALRKASYGEAFALTGNNLYNPAWGYQAGKERSANTIGQILPRAIVDYSRVLAKRHSLRITAVAEVSSTVRGGLEWMGASTPLPDNYRYLPSYFYDPNISQAVSQAWVEGDSRYTQIDFDELYRRNALQPQAVYIAADRVLRNTDIQLSASVSSRFGQSSTVNYGLRMGYSRQRNFKRATDLLGGKPFEDIDYFLEDDDTYSNMLLNNMDSPDRVISRGDRYGYDYAINQLRAGAFVGVAHQTDNFNISATAEVSGCRINRYGYYRKELFAENSAGASKVINVSELRAECNANYVFGPKHMIFGAVSVGTDAPEAENLFLQSQYNNRIIDTPATAQRYAATAGYRFRGAKFGLQTTLFARYSCKMTDVSHIYFDAVSEFSDIVTTDIAMLAAGVEVEARYNIVRGLEVTAGASAGLYRYTGQPRVVVYSDKDNRLLGESDIAAAAGLHTGRTPSLTALAAAEYYNRGWSISLGANYYGLRYVAPSLIRRADMVIGHAADEADRAELLTQERLPDAFTMDFRVSKSIYLSRFDRKIYKTAAAPRFTDRYPRSRIVVMFAVDNLLGNSNIVYRGYESSRMRKKYLWEDFTLKAFPNYYLYAYPRSYYLQIAFKF